MSNDDQTNPAARQVTAQDFSDLSNTVAELIGELQERVGSLEAELAAQKASPELDPETLPDWVDWLKTTYDIEGRIPHRWEEQPHMVAELAALRAAWAAAMHTADDEEGVDRPHLSSAALSWHESLHRAMARWHDGYVTSGCAVDVEPLTDWVEWLKITYELDNRIPRKWETIPGCTEELAALRASYRAAYTWDGRPRTTIEAGAWHEALERCLRRVNDMWESNHSKREMDERDSFPTEF